MTGVVKVGRASKLARRFGCESRARAWKLTPLIKVERVLFADKANLLPHFPAFRLKAVSALLQDAARCFHTNNGTK